MKTILVLFGGCSTEHEVSLQSAYGVLTHMDPGRYTPLPVGITREGRWLWYAGPLEHLVDGTWESRPEAVPCTLSLDRGTGRLLVLDGSGGSLTFDAAFPILHGKNGEDGTVQGLLELTGVPLIGCGALSSALCMDKDRARKLAALAGVRVPGSILFRRGADFHRIAAAAEGLGYPLFVKPVRAGSSFGVSWVDMGTAASDSADALINATITWTLIAGEDNSQEALNARAEAGEATVSKETYTVKTDSVFAAIDGGDETLIAAKAQVDARDASVASNRDLYAATIVLQVGSNAAAARYEEAKDSFLWVKNIWLSDTSYSHPINLEDGVPEAAYEQLTLELGAQKTEANGYYILIIISIGTMFLSQFILSKSNKAQNELQTADGRGKKTQRVMMIVMPIIFGIFSFMYSAGFTIYMIVGNVYNILSSLTINFIIDKKFRKNEEREIREKYNKRIPQSARDGGKKV